MPFHEIDRWLGSWPSWCTFGILGLGSGIATLLMFEFLLSYPNTALNGLLFLIMGFGPAFFFTLGMNLSLKLTGLEGRIGRTGMMGGIVAGAVFSWLGAIAAVVFKIFSDNALNFTELCFFGSAIGSTIYLIVLAMSTRRFLPLLLLTGLGLTLFHGTELWTGRSSLWIWPFPWWQGVMGTITGLHVVSRLIEKDLEDGFSESDVDVVFAGSNPRSGLRSGASTTLLLYALYRFL